MALVKYLIRGVDISITMHWSEMEHNASTDIRFGHWGSPHMVNRDSGILKKTDHFSSRLALSQPHYVLTMPHQGLRPASLRPSHLHLSKSSYLQISALHLSCTSSRTRISPEAPSYHASITVRRPSFRSRPHTPGSTTRDQAHDLRQRVQQFKASDSR